LAVEELGGKPNVVAACEGLRMKSVPVVRPKAPKRVAVPRATERGEMGRPRKVGEVGIVLLGIGYEIWCGGRKGG
jgi:hypothetical protein